MEHVLYAGRLQKHIEDRLSEELLRSTIQRGDRVKIDVQDGKLTVEQLERSSVNSKAAAE